MKENLIHFIEKTPARFLIVHPPSFKSWNVAAFLVPQITGKQVTIITQNYPKIDACLTAPLPDGIYITYDEIENSDILKGTLNVENSFVIIDDLEMYQQYDLTKYFNIDQIKSKVVCLTNGLRKYELIKDFLCLSMTLYNEGPVFGYTLCMDKTEVDVINFILMRIHQKHFVYTDLSENFTKIFNVSNAIVSSNLSDYPSGVEHIHIFNIELLKDELYLFIDKVNNRALYNNSIDTINVIFYINRDKEEEVQIYEKIATSIEEYTKNYQELLKMSTGIKYNTDLGVYVERN